MTFNIKQPVAIPLSPRASLYHPDGYGRDSYIYNNNGGLYKSGQRVVNSIDLTNLNNPSVKNMKFSSCKKSGIPKKYISDGSGRDSYVK